MQPTAHCTKCPKSYGIYSQESIDGICSSCGGKILIPDIYDSVVTFGRNRNQEEKVKKRNAVYDRRA